MKSPSADHDQTRKPLVQRGALLPGTFSKSQRFCLLCGRPKRVCICDSLPAVPIATAGRVVILQHPSERKRNLATVPVLLRVLQHLQVIVGRFIKPNQAPWPEILGDSQPLYVLYPVEDAVDVALLAARRSFSQAEDGGSQCSSHNTIASEAPHAWTLLAFDGSWAYGKEMMRASKDKLLQRPGPTTFVKIPELAVPCAAAAADPGAAELDAEGPCLLRKEPNEAALCTYEAIARSLACLESWGPEQLAHMMAPLRLMTRLQAQFNPSIGDREAAFAASSQVRSNQPH